MANETNPGKDNPVARLKLFVSTFEISCPNCTKEVFRTVGNTVDLTEGDTLKVEWTCYSCGYSYRFKTSGPFVIERIEDGTVN